MLNIAHVSATAVSVDSNYTGAPAAQATQNNMGNGSDDADQPPLSAPAQLPGLKFTLFAMPVLTNVVLPAQAATEPSSIAPRPVSQTNPDPTMCVHGN